MANNDVAVQEFYLDLSQLSYTGENLVRPESILAQRDGTLWVSDGRGGITRIDPSGTQHFLPGLGGEPNGLAMLADGSLLIANIAGGAVQHWYPDGHTENFLTEVDGVPITTPNFVFRIARNVSGSRFRRARPSGGRPPRSRVPTAISCWWTSTARVSSPTGSFLPTRSAWMSGKSISMSRKLWAGISCSAFSRPDSDGSLDLAAG